MHGRPYLGVSWYFLAAIETHINQVKANGRGFININPNLGLNLPDKKAGLSVFHQLHCLVSLLSL